MDVPSPVIVRYLERRKNEVAQCEVALKNLDFDPLMRMGHQLKGNGTTFGFPELSDMGSRLEVAALSKDKKETETALGAISDWINKKIS